MLNSKWRSDAYGRNKTNNILTDYITFAKKIKDTQKINEVDKEKKKKENQEEADKQRLQKLCQEIKEKDPFLNLSAIRLKNKKRLVRNKKKSNLKKIVFEEKKARLCIIEEDRNINNCLIELCDCDALNKYEGKIEKKIYEKNEEFFQTKKLLDRSNTACDKRECEEIAIESNTRNDYAKKEEDYFNKKNNSIYSNSKNNNNINNSVCRNCEIGETQLNENNKKVYNYKKNVEKLEESSKNKFEDLKEKIRENFEAYSYAKCCNAETNKKQNFLFIRDYVDQIIDEELNNKVEFFLSELARFQDRSYKCSKSNFKFVSRYVLGLRSIQKAIQKKKVKAVFVAPNIEPNVSAGGLSSIVENLIKLCKSENVPVIFCLSRNRFKSVLNKSVRQSAVGIINFGGAEELFFEILRISDDKRKLWYLEKTSTV